MPMPISVDATWMNNASVSYNAQELRRADTVSFNGDGSAFGVRGGIILHGDTSLDISVNASDVVTVQPGAVVIPGNSGTGNGVYRCALGAADTGTLAARSATLPRIDLVVFRALDTDVVAGHGAYTGRIEFVAGTPAASPVAPALPAMAVELGRITVPIVGGGTATIDKTNRTYACAVGGILPVPTVSKLPGVDTKWDRAIAIDTGYEYQWDGSAWQIDRRPRGVLAYSQVTADELSVTGASPLSGMSQTLTLPAGRRIRITAQLRVDSTVSGDTARATIKEDGNQIQLMDMNLPTANIGNTMICQVIRVSAAGSHTYTLSVGRVIGSGNTTSRATSTNPAYLVVEDIGAA